MVVESFRPGVVDRLGIGFDDLVAVNPGIILCSTTGYGQSGPRAAWAGHDINYLAVGRLPGRHRAARRRRAAGVRRHHRRRRRRRDAGGHGDHGRPDRAGWERAGRPPRRLHRRRRALAHLAGRRRAPGHRGRGRATATTSSPAATPATTPTRRPTAAGWRSGPSSPSSTPTCAGSSGASSGPTTSSTTTSRTRSGTDFQAAFATKDRDAWVAELAAADTCVTPGADRWPSWSTTTSSRPATPSSRRSPVRPAPTGRAPIASARSAPLLAGMPAPDEPVEVGDPLRSDTDRLLAAAGLAPSHIGGLRERGIVA